ncbi:hypothetical protein GCQ56_18000 [Marinifilum sp. N1E240]|uniref:hypothetical protein n=1 Tax=Marinifilum sp. N1E240 TaxID=2608082 RepID=UPI00128E3D7E|nr:hypothetical protein [Marinifilum sp. N1E240]MPQ48895.1 hypothetical protein [Marinifilum sp. N1E240]
MKKTEKILAAISILGILLSLNLIPYGGTLSIISMTCLAILYMYLSFALFNDIPIKGIFKKDSYTKISKLRVFGTIVTGLVLSVSIIGILFKSQLYPYSSILLAEGVIGLFIAAIVAFVQLKRSKDKFYFNILKRIVIIGILSIIFYLIPREKILEISYRNHPEYVEAIKKAWTNPDNMALWDKVYEESLKIHK